MRTASLWLPDHVVVVFSLAASVGDLKLMLTGKRIIIESWQRQQLMLSSIYAFRQSAAAAASKHRLKQRSSKGLSGQRTVAWRRRGWMMEQLPPLNVNN